MRFTLLMASLVTFITSCSQPASTKKPAASSKSKTNNTLLWEITGNGLTKPSYFFGTMHILCSDDATISPGLQNIIDNVGQIYLEIDMDDMMQMFGAMNALAMTGNKTLKDFYTEEEYAKVKGWFEKNGQIPFAMLEKYKPMLLASMIEENAMSCPEKDGMEMRIMNAASEKKIEIKGLETMAFQAGMLDSIPYDEQAKGLLEAIDSVKTQRKMVQRLVKEYKSQNLDSINALTQSEEGGMDKYLDLLLYSRNRNWVNQFDKIATEKSTLFAVGAGHLPGDQGVLNLLKKKGFTVKPLENNTLSKKA
jgi:uncharacterized protein